MLDTCEAFQLIYSAWQLSRFLYLLIIAIACSYLHTRCRCFSLYSLPTVADNILRAYGAMIIRFHHVPRGANHAVKRYQLQWTQHRRCMPSRMAPVAHNRYASEYWR